MPSTPKKPAAKAAPKAAKPAAKPEVNADAKTVAKSAVKPAAKATPKAATAETSSARVKPAAFKLKDLVARLDEAGLAKKKDLKPVAEAVLAVLGQELARGSELNLPGLGRIKVAKTAEAGGVTQQTLKLKRGAKSGAEDAKQALADPGEDG